MSRRWRGIVRKCSFSSSLSWRLAIASGRPLAMKWQAALGTASLSRMCFGSGMRTSSWARTLCWWVSGVSRAQFGLRHEQPVSTRLLMRMNKSTHTHCTVILSRISRGSENHPTRPDLRCWTTVCRGQPAIACLSSFM